MIKKEMSNKERADLFYAKGEAAEIKATNYLEKGDFKKAAELCLLAIEYIDASNKLLFAEIHDIRGLLDAKLHKYGIQ